MITRPQSLADLLDQGRIAFQRLRQAERAEQTARKAEQDRLDREHWHACRSAILKDLPPYLIDYSNITADPPEDWTGGVALDGGWVVEPARGFTLSLDCPRCALVQRVYQFTGIGGWQPYGMWQVPIYETGYARDGIPEPRLSAWHAWHRYDDLATALADAEDYLRDGYSCLLNAVEQACIEWRDSLTEVHPEPKPLDAGGLLLLAVERVVAQMVRPTCLQSHEEDE